MVSSLAISAFCRFRWASVLFSTNLRPRTVQIGYLLAFAVDIPVFSLLFLHRVCSSILICTVVLVRVLFPFRRSNCLNLLFGRTCVHVSGLLLFRPSCRFFELSSLVHSRLFICRLQISILMLTILLVLHSRIRSSFLPLLISYILLTSSAVSCFSLVISKKKSALLWNLFRSGIKCNRNSEYNCLMSIRFGSLSLTVLVISVIADSPNAQMN